MVHLEGYVSHIRYHNEENGYTVLEIETTHGDEILVGNFRFSIDAGEYLSVEADFTDHPVHGPQYTIRSYEVRGPQGRVAMERYLASGAIKGIGAALAKRIMKKFKENTFEIMESEPERLAEVKGISLKKAMDIAVQFQEKQEMRMAMMFLADYGVSNHFAVKIYEEYGENMYEVLKTNPYKLAEDIHGIGFKVADSIAAKAGIAQDSSFRICSGILYTLQMASGAGHVYLPRDLLCREAGRLMGVDPSFVEDHLIELIIDKKIMIREIDSDQQVYLSVFYFLERNVAGMLHDCNVSFPLDETEWSEKMKWLQEGADIEIDATQEAAVRKSLEKGVVIVTGGPGTGKTTTINLMIRVFLQDDLKILLAAPTGRAAKRMTEATGQEAKTIHRLLEISGGLEDEGRMHFERDESNPLEADVIIVDEMSMVDITLINALLKAVVAGTRLILVGDENQLPSVGPGQVLRDLIRSQMFEVVHLTHIYRQAQTSHIILNAHKINQGQQISLGNNNRDFFFFEKNDIRSVLGGLIYLVQTRLPEYAGIRPFDIQVLAPMRKGEIGVTHLNEVLQYYLNPASPDKKERETPNALFREGDKVMQIRNNYQLEWKIRNKKGRVVEEGLGIFNGDLGLIREINTFTEKMTVIYDDNREVEYPFSGLDELELAYAITIHKSQGSEYPAVVIPLLTGPPVLCNRNLLYTAVTRARQCVCIIGRHEMVDQMIANASEHKRYTGLTQCLTEYKDLLSIP